MNDRKERILVHRASAKQFLEEKFIALNIYISKVKSFKLEIFVLH